MNPHDIVGRVAFAAHARFRLLTARGDEPALLAPWLQDGRDPIVVGDRVRFERGDPLVVVERLPRDNVLRRRDPGGFAQVVAANVDCALICMAVDRDFNLRRIERWLLVAGEAGIPPLVALTKADVTADLDARLADVATVAPGVPVLAISAYAGLGRDELLARVPPGSTAALLGASGVGKSTLVNWLTGAEVATGRTTDDGRGRHTTSARHLLALPNGAWLIDNPGTRGVGPLADADLSTIWPEIDALAARCRFRDCGHDGEPDCAVQDALTDGTLPHERYAAWRKLERELAFEARRSDPRVMQEHRRTWKRIHKARRRRVDED